MAQSQAITAPLTRAATFLVLSMTDASDSAKTVRSGLGSVSDIAKNVAIRAPDAAFSCTVGIGPRIWDEVTQLPKPKELHPFKEVKGAKHTAPSTEGDLLFHIRANRRDLTFEFERQLLDILGSSVKVVDETVGFRYFDARDLLGFVDGTANPVGPAVGVSALCTEDMDTAAVGGSYITIQKYIHDLDGWKKLPIEQQEKIIGRTKVENIELPDQDDPAQKPHKQLTTIEVDGKEHDILRDNMPFGSPASGEFGTYFIGYSKQLWVTEKMMERMFVGVPEGKHDRILDFSTAKTGCVFFAPSAEVLEGLGD